MPTIKGLFFDLDGTLVNTYEADYLAYRDAIEEVTGVVVEREAFAKTHGMHMHQKLERLLPDPVDAATAEQIAEAKKRFYGQYISETVPNETLIRFLADNTQHHVTALVTTAKRHNAERVLAYHSLAPYFDFIICGEDVKQHKPHPEAYVLALAKAKLSPAEVIAFEDSESGLTAAEKAGLSVIRITSFA